MDDILSGVEILLDDYVVKSTPTLPAPLPPYKLAFPVIAPLPHNARKIGGFDLVAEVRRFIASEYERYQAREVTIHSYESVKTEAGAFAAWLHGNDITELTRDVLQSYRLHRIGKYNRGEAALSTTQRMLYMVKRVVEWLLDGDIIERTPGNLKKITTFHPAEPDDEDEDIVETFTVDEVRALWAKADSRTRLYIALGLNCGFLPHDVGELKHSEYRPATQDIKRRRCKTRKKIRRRYRWALWDVTRTLLELHAEPVGKYPDEKGKDSYMLRCPDGTPLYIYEKVEKDGKQVTHRSNDVENAFKVLRKQCGIKLPFKTFRATGASLVHKFSDIDTSKLFLAHGPRSIAEKHYLAEEWTGLDKALLAVEATLGLE
jgi:hypothetical protein